MLGEVYGLCPTSFKLRATADLKVRLGGEHFILEANDWPICLGHVTHRKEAHWFVVTGDQLLFLCRQFATINTQKFLELWLMNEEEAKGLMRKVLDADRIIHTQQLGLLWSEPSYWFLNNMGPIIQKGNRTATALAQEALEGGIHRKDISVPLPPGTGSPSQWLLKPALLLSPDPRGRC